MFVDLARDNSLNAPKNSRVIVGLSGGVDSSVVALLLKQQGYQVEALFMKNWEEDDTFQVCQAEEDLLVVKAICKQLNIPLHTINFSSEYWDNVFAHFLIELKRGRTPNPDILCNKEIKFKAFLNHAMQLKADYIATGHYAICKLYRNVPCLYKGLDNNKDQSYFLYTLTQSQLEKTLFPLGKIEKATVRNIAKQAGLPNHARKDSTGICFIGEKKFKRFLQRYLPANKGEMITPTGDKIGQHDGLMYYTIGQRQGLNIGGLKRYPDAPWYVVNKDIKNNTLIVAQGEDNPLLFGRSLSVIDIIGELNSTSHFPYQCLAKIRYRQNVQKCIISQTNDTTLVEFENRQRAITPGQAIVFYEGERCLGGGTIDTRQHPI